MITGYTSLGCWKDSDPRAIPTLEGSCVHLDGSYVTRTDHKQKCVKCANEMGMKIFALQDGGWCSGTTTDGDDYKKYGKSSDCENNGLGGGLANHVYKFDVTSGKIEQHCI